MPERLPTERLEQQDSYLTSFHARVLATDEIEGSAWVLLDRSAFYPESGGQPADQGTLGGAEVVDVQVRGGEVWHKVEGPAPVVGATVPGEIDWERRFRHMQRHTAQHLLSQAFLQVERSFETQSVGLSGPDCTLDLAGEPLEAALAQAEVLVNRVAYLNLPITTFAIDETEVDDYPLRRPPKVKGTIRLVEVGDFELSACGGTHTATTAEVAPIKVLKSERIRGDLTRVTFRAGLEALEDYREKHEVTHGLAVSFSSRVGELPMRIGALREAERSAAHAAELANRRLTEAMAKEARAEASTMGDLRIVRRMLPPEDAHLLQPLAESLADLPGTVALLGVRDERKARLVFARSSETEIDLRPVLEAALEVVGGRGGGRPDFAQGGGPGAGALEDALERAERELPTQP